MTEGNAEGTGRIDALRAAAEANDARAQVELANRLFFGDGVARDPEEAYRWMRKAAEAGIAEAQSKVGFFLTMGFGVAPDPKGAIRWFLRGLKGGYAKAGYNLGEAYQMGRHVTFSPRRAWFFFSKAVELGQEAAHYGLARLCYKGQGVPKDVGKSMEHLRRALRADDSGAIVEMGRVYRAGDAGPEDLAEAEARALARHRPGDLASLRVLFELRREATAAPPPPDGYDAVVAELNRRQALRREKEQPAAATFREAVDLYWGHGVLKDAPRAVALLESAAGAGNADAARFLALAYEGDGDGVPKSREGANRWWGEAARLGDAHGSYVVGAALLDAASTEEDEARGRALLEHAAALGFPHACGHLGDLLAREIGGPDEELLEELSLPLLRLGAVRGDDRAGVTLARVLEALGGSERLREAAFWLHGAARRSAVAARELGLAHGRGLGVEPNAGTAAAWLARAADEGDAEAAAHLAACFVAGTGVPRDLQIAAGLAERAAEGGSGLGARVLGEIHTDGLGVPRDDRMAAAWYRRGAELGDAFSMSCYAKMLFDGRGVRTDPAAAVRWLESATDRGPDGLHLLAVMRFRGEGTAPDPAEARRLFVRSVADERIPSLFTTIEEEALRFRPAGTRPERMTERIEEAAEEIEVLPARGALDAGILVWNGDVGLVCDDALAARFFRAAAEKGDALAAACLSYALGLAGDLEGEREWLEKAAAAGLPGAQRHLAVRLVSTGRAGRDDPHVVALYESAADAGDAIACMELADLLERAGASLDARGADRVAALRRCALEGGYPA